MIIANINRSAGWQKFRLLFNAIIGGGGHPSFSTISARTLNYATLLDTSFVECGCIQRIPSSHFQLQLRHLNQTAISSQSFPQVEAIDNEQSQSHQQAKSSPEHDEEEQQNGTDSSATTITSKAEEENVQQQNREEQQQQLNENQLKPYQQRYFSLAKSFTFIGPNRKLEIECKQGTSGRKFFLIQIVNLPNIIHFNLPNILVPQEAYKFVEAMDRLISQLPAEKPTNPENYESQPILATEMVEGGKNFDFKLSTVWHQRSGQWNLEMRTVKTVKEHKERFMHIPLSTIPWLRHQMVTMLAKHDGSVQMEMGKPPSIPQWAWAKQAKVRASSPPLEQNNQPKSSAPMHAAQNLTAQLQQQQAQLASIETMLRQTQFLLANIVQQQQQSSTPPQMGQQQSPQQQQLAQIQAQIAQLAGAMNIPNPNYHQLPSFVPGGFTVPPASASSLISSSTAGTITATNPFQSAPPPNPALQQSTAGAAAAALVAQLIDQLKKANSMGTVKAMLPKNRKNEF